MSHSKQALHEKYHRAQNTDSHEGFNFRMDHRRNNAREQTENQDTAMVSHMFVQQKLQNKEILEKLRSVSPDLTIPHSEKT